MLHFHRDELLVDPGFEFRDRDCLRPVADLRPSTSSLRKHHRDNSPLQQLQTYETCLTACHWID